MNSFSHTVRIFVVVCLAFAAATVVHGQGATRTWVSAVGDDANPCSRTLPCKTFARAISMTTGGGEINCLDPGGYGAVTITKSIAINGGGTLASIFSSSQVAITVNATPNDRVILRNLSLTTIPGSGTIGQTGIKYVQANSLTIENCQISNFSVIAIDAALTTNGNLKVIDTSIDNSVNVALTNAMGISLTTTGVELIALISNTRIQRCTIGIRGINNVRAAISDCLITPFSVGIQTTGANCFMNVAKTFISYARDYALQSSTNSTINVSDCILAQNGSSLNATNGKVVSFGGNARMSNTADPDFTETKVKS